MSVQSFTPPGSHPVLACLDAVESALKDVADVEPAFMSTAQKRAALVAHARVEAQLAELGLRVLATADDVAADDGRPRRRGLARPPQPGGPGHRPPGPAAGRGARAAVAGRAGGDAGRVRCRWSRRTSSPAPWTSCPTTSAAEVRALAEERLVAEAASFGPKELRVMGRRILDVVAPELGEEQERKALEAEETAAEARTWLTGRRRGDGTHRGQRSTSPTRRGTGWRPTWRPTPHPGGPARSPRTPTTGGPTR